LNLIYELQNKTAAADMLPEFVILVLFALCVILSVMYAITDRESRREAADTGADTSVGG
jgi:hypothetical protein